MSTSSSSQLSLSLAEQQLAKLTNDSPEIRLRALDQIETRFIRCLQHGEMVDFKPATLLKQLIRWFGFTPLAVPHRVLAFMLELMRSDYSDAIVRKIPAHRLDAELSKIRKILGSQESTRTIELLDNLQSVVDGLYKESNSSANSNSSGKLNNQAIFQEPSGESVCSTSEMDLFSLESFNIAAKDFEPAWSKASADDFATMKTLVDSLTIANDVQLQENLTNLRVKMSDYPAEHLCQAPHIYLQLLHVQQLQAGITLLHVNRALLTFVKLLQRRLRVRKKSLEFPCALGPQEKTPKQLRITTVLRLLLNSCLELLGPPLLEHCSHNWHTIELIVEVVKTFGQLECPVPENIVHRLGLIAPKLIRYCVSFEVGHISEMPTLVNKLMIPRLESLIFNGLLLDVLALNLSNEGEIDIETTRKLLRPVVLDSSYLSCVPMRMQELWDLCGTVRQMAILEEHHMVRLKEAYNSALDQMLDEVRLPPMELLKGHRQMSLVLLLLGSESLILQLTDAIVKCTGFFISKPTLRLDAESLMETLFELPDERLRNCALRQLKKPIVEHFHAFLNSTTYITGCNNIDLAKRHILGVPMSSNLLRKLLVQGWRPEHSAEMQQWCVDYVIMLVGLAKLVPGKDFNEIIQILSPVLPLLVCRAVSHPQLQHLLWDMLDPDHDHLEPKQVLRGNVCYLFHSEAKYRSDAITRIAYVLEWMDHQNKYLPAMDSLSLELIGHDLCAIQPPVNYDTFFSDRSSVPYTRGIHTLLRLLETPDLKTSIRKSSLVQLNVLLHNWDSVSTLIDRDGAYVLCLTALHDPLLRNDCGSTEELETLEPAVSILLRVLFHSERFRQEFKDNGELVDCLLRCLFLLPNEAKLRAEVSICIFLLLFHDHITATDSCLKLDVDLCGMVIPVTYEVDLRLPPSEATEGLALKQHLLTNHFDNNVTMESQHWRLFIAHRLCGSPEQLSIAEIQKLDIRDSLKLKPSDLALVHASLVHQQLQSQLVAANNCSSHATLQQLVASIQLFLVLLRNDVPPPQSSHLWQLMHKYLRLMPGNEADLQLYVALLELCLSCLRHRLTEVLVGLNKALETDPHHSFLEILRDGNVSLHLLSLVTDCLVQLLRWDRHKGNSGWHSILFDELSALARKHFEERNLQHVRCVLAVLRHLSEQRLQLDTPKIQAYYRHYVQLSSNLRTTTYTGAQWQRDCLLIVCQLHSHGQILQPVTGSKVSVGSKVMRYILGLCGHADTEVRSLSWVAMANWIKCVNHDMSTVLSEFNDFLPGGLAACCLSTMLDEHETLLIRELSGRTFELLIPHIGAIACSDLLMYHSFLKQAHAGVVALQLPSDNKESAGSHCSFQLISCYVSICVNLIVLEPNWTDTLCNHSFFNALSDLLKMPKPEKLNNAYLEMCAGQICKLYALCYQSNFTYLQRSICRDPVLLKAYLTLISDVLDQKVVPENQLVQLLKLLMVFFKDQNSYAFLTESFTLRPELLFDLLLYGLNPIFVHRTLQRYTMLVLSLLMIRAQDVPDELNLLKIFESFVEEAPSNEPEKEETPAPINTDSDSDDKENSTTALNAQLERLSIRSTGKQERRSKAKKSAPMKTKEYTNAAVLLYHNLDQLFDLHYPAKTYSFLRAPSKSHVQVCEVLGILLKHSSWSADAARKYKLLERVMHLLETFLDDGNVGNATVYVRRVGAHKSRDIINNLLVLLNMLKHWQNTPHAVVTDTVMAARIVRVLVRLWPWFSHSFVLKLMAVRLTTLFTEHSFEMCKQTSQVMSNQSHSLLQLMVRVADHETTKKEGSVPKPDNSKCSTDSIVEAALRVMINCCSCAEGRLSLGKMRVLDMFDTLMPAGNSNLPKVKPEVLLVWLSFWEIFSRYELGCKICHLQALMDVVRRSPPLSRMRLRCLRIVRNMCFSNHNRMQLVNMPSFSDFLRDVVTQPVPKICDGGGDLAPNESYEEHHLVVLCLWKLFGFSAKCKAMLRGTKLYKHLTILWDNLATQNRMLPFETELKVLLSKLFESLKP